MLRSRDPGGQDRKPQSSLRHGRSLPVLAALIGALALAFQADHPSGDRSGGVVSLLIPAAHAREKKKRSTESSESSEDSKESESSKESGERAAELLVEAQKQSAEIEREQAKQSTEIESENRQESSSESEDRREGSDRDRVSTSGGRTGIGRGDDGEEGPPRTVAEIFRRLSRTNKAKLPASSGGGGGTRVNSPRASNEILAVNLSPKGAARARKLGFNVGGSAHVAHLRGNVTRLVPPAGMDAKQARDVMQKSQPRDEFAVNQRYSVYQPARKDMSGGPDRSEPARHGVRTPCTGDKCFGRQAIRWHDDIQTCASGLKVGVIDTLVDSNHPSFSHAKIHLGGFLPDGSKPAPTWHGTGVLGLLAGDNDSGTPGLIPDASFYAASVFFLDEKGEAETDTLSVLNALEWMSAFDVKIVNMSFSGPRDELVEKAINRMSEEGVIFVAAVGNDGPTAAPRYPASYGPVVAVTAISEELKNYPYANRGDKVDAAAPGVNIWSAVPDAREGYHTGTSFAVPYITAILATLYNKTPAHLRKDAMLDRLRVLDLGPPGRDPIYGRGLALAPMSCVDGGAGVVARATPPSPSPATPTSTSAWVGSDDHVTLSAEPFSFR